MGPYDVRMFAISIVGDYYLIAMLSVMLHCFFDEGIIWNRKKSLLVLGFSVLNAFITPDMLLNPLVGILNYVMVVAVIVYGCNGHYIKRSLLSFFVYYIVSAIYSGILMMGLFYFFPENYNLESQNQLSYWEYGILVVVFAVCYYRMKHLYLKKDVHLKFGKRVYFFLGAYSFFIMIMYVMMLMLREFPELPELEQGIQGILVAFLMAFCLLIPFYLIKSQVSNYYQNMNEYQEIFLQEQLRILERYKAAEEETRRIRHDMKNNLACISMLLQEGKLQEASDYTEGLLQDISSLSPKIVTGDEMLNCVFSAKLDWMQKENISFEIDGVLDRGLDWKPIDVCKVFANAIDNAIEACMKIPDRDKRKISVSLKRTKQYYSIEMKNSIADKKLCVPLMKDISNTRYTTKNNKKFHGLGLSNMYRTVEKYGGMMKVDCQEQEFVLNIVV